VAAEPPVVPPGSKTAERSAIVPDVGAIVGIELFSVPAKCIRRSPVTPPIVSELFDPIAVVGVSATPVNSNRIIDLAVMELVNVSVGVNAAETVVSSRHSSPRTPASEPD
jgi:hypothetical protein